MKELYKSPVISVEELAKADVLCASDNYIEDAAVFVQAFKLSDYLTK